VRSWWFSAVIVVSLSPLIIQHSAFRNQLLDAPKILVMDAKPFKVSPRSLSVCCATGFLENYWIGVPN
jgi:hypothetical protein